MAMPSTMDCCGSPRQLRITPPAQPGNEAQMTAGPLRHHGKALQTGSTALWFCEGCISLILEIQSGSQRIFGIECVDQYYSLKDTELSSVVHKYK